MGRYLQMFIERKEVENSFGAQLAALVAEVVASKPALPFDTHRCREKLNVVDGEFMPERAAALSDGIEPTSEGDGSES